MKVGLLTAHGFFLRTQLVDSSIKSTREFWRRKLGCSEEVVNDPRPLREVLRDERST